MPDFDIIIAGGGTAGGVIAGRLAAADPSLKILILEAGPHTMDDPMHVQPARYSSHLAPTSSTVRFYPSKPSEHTGGRQVVVPTGACVGGGSSVNFCMYTRAAASDYDDWTKRFGNKGWSSKDLLPLLKKTESYQLPDLANPRDTHGFDGPLKVSYGGAFTNIGKDFLDVASSYDSTRGVLADTNSLHDINGYARWQKWIGAGTGKRSDVAHHFLYNQKANKNLHITVGCVVQRVTFEETRAVGVEYRFHPRFHSNEDCGTLHVAKASKLVIVCAGALGSPQILERSGLGRKEVLDAAGVQQLVDLAGVGENYQDHQGIFPPFFASDESQTLDGIVRNKEEDIEAWETLWKTEGSGLMAHNGIDAGGKLRPSVEELEDIGPHFKQRWEEYFQDASDKPVIFLGAVSTYIGDLSNAPDRKYFSMACYIQYPSSMGRVHIRSTNPLDDPDFEPGYLGTKDDLAILKWGYKKSREIARRMPSYRGEYDPGHPVFPTGSQARTKQNDHPVAIGEPDFGWSPEDDEAIEQYLRNNVGTTWHSLGTCAMKARAEGGVVDSQLNVYGTQGLKCADMSICPSNVSANTYSTALVIGEKAAVIIAAELGIAGVTGSPI